MSNIQKLILISLLYLSIINIKYSEMFAIIIYYINYCGIQRINGIITDGKSMFGVFGYFFF